MGYFADEYSAGGNFYLSTNTEEPFCGQGHILELQISENSPRTKGDISFKIKGKTNNIFRSINR